MTTGTVVTLVSGVVSDTMGTFGGILPAVLLAFTVLVAVAFGIHVFRKYVFKKKV